MATVKELAQKYEAPKTLNVSDLEKFDIQTELELKTYPKDDGTTFSYLVATIDGKQYRVPKVVLEHIKAYLLDIPDLRYVKVRKTGEGKTDTKYFVTPLKE